MFGESQPQAAPAPQNIPNAPSNSQGGGGYNPAGGGQTVVNPALGALGVPVQLPQNGATPQPQSPFASPGLLPNQAANPYAPQPQGNPSPYQPPVQTNPYGQPQQGSPYAAPPAPFGGYQNPYETPAGQAAPARQDLQNPAYQFNPYGQPAPVQQPQQQQFQQPQQQLQQQQQPLQQLQPQQQPQQLTAQQLAQQPQGITPEQVQQIFPDATSQAIFQGMDSIAKGQNIDLLQAFGQAYERRDPSLVNERYLAQFDPTTAATLRGQFNALVQAGQARDSQIEQSVYQMAGGQQQWQLAVQAFNTSADLQTRQAVAAAVDSGDPNQIRLAVQAVLQHIGASGNMIQRSGQSLTPNGGGGATREVMTNENFRQHLGWLEQAHPVGSPEYNKHYQILVEQRRQAKALGY